MKKQFAFCMIVIAFLGACKKNSDNTTTTPATQSPMLIFKFKFDSTQVRLDNVGAPAAVPAGHSAQSPRFNQMSAHYIELAPYATTLLGTGTVLYHAPETTAGGNNAISFDQSVRVGEGQAFFSVPLKNVSAGTYQWLRVSLAYQNYDINFRYLTYDLTGTLASFIGFNTYINNVKIKDSTIHVGGNRLQGYWAFETIYSPVDSAQAPSGTTTVPNPLFATSPIPAGSCVVTGAFTSPLTITGSETQDIIVTVSLSTNKSFEWVEHSTPDIFEPANGDTVVDMGVRGMIPSHN